MEAAVWICIDIFPTRSHSSPLLPLRFLRSCRAFFRLDVCVYMRNQCTQIIVSFFGFFFSSFNSTLYCIYHTVLCAMSGERIFSHKLNHLRIINKLEYLPFCHFSINCVLNSLILPLSLSLRCCWILIFFFFCWCFSFHYVHARLPVALLHSNQPLLFPHIFFISLAQNKLNFAKREKEWEKKRSTRFASKSTLNGWIYLSATHMLCGDMQNVHREYIIRSVRA